MSIARVSARVVWLLVLGVSLVTLAAVSLSVMRAHPSPEVEQVQSVGSRPGAAPPTANAPVPGASRRADEQQPLASPTRLRIGTLGIDAPIVRVALDDASAVEIPRDVGIVGWYELGVPPGAYRGSAVLVGHRDGRAQGHGAFYDLGLLNVGDRIGVTDATGRTLRFVVVARESIAKRRVPYEELFAVDGPPRLTLISCGGYYDPTNGGYQDNVIVTAVPA